jgi:hypothetical protein
MPDEAPPPIGKTWPRLYTFVIVFLIVEVIVFALFTRAFA